jgi:hypothetical protein
VIKIEKEFSYGIIAIVSIVGLFVLFNSGIVKIGGGELSGQATLLKNERNVDCFSKFETCNNDLTTCNGYLTDCANAWSETNTELTVCSSELTEINGYLTDCADAWQTTKNELTSCQENLASSIQISTLCTSFPEACGCTDEGASNYDELAIVDDGSCSNNFALLFDGSNMVHSVLSNKIQHPSGDPFILTYFIKKTGNFPTSMGYPRIVSLSSWSWNSEGSFETAIKRSDNTLSWWRGIWYDSVFSIQDDVVYFVKWEYTGDDMILTITDWESQQTDMETWSNIAGTIDFDNEDIYIGSRSSTLSASTNTIEEGFVGIIEQVRLRSYTNEILTYGFNEGEGNTIQDSINDYDGVIISHSTEDMWVEGLP